MRGPDPAEYGWWLASRASGIVALLAITFSVTVGLAMASGLLRRPGLKRKLVAWHEHAALAGLVSIAVHAITLLGDRWLAPGLTGILVPFAIDHEPLATGLGVIAAYLAAMLGLSFYLRRRIGARRWRSMHRATIAVYVLALAHAVAVGSDAGTPWLRGLLVASAAPVLFFATARWLPTPQTQETTR